MLLENIHFELILTRQARYSNWDLPCYNKE